MTAPTVETTQKTTLNIAAFTRASLGKYLRAADKTITNSPGLPVSVSINTAGQIYVRVDKETLIYTYEGLGIAGGVEVTSFELERRHIATLCTAITNKLTTISLYPQTGDIELYGDTEKPSTLRWLNTKETTIVDVHPGDTKNALSINAYNRVGFNALAKNVSTNANDDSRIRAADFIFTPDAAPIAYATNKYNLAKVTFTPESSEANHPHSLYPAIEAEYKVLPELLSFAARSYAGAMRFTDKGFVTVECRNGVEVATIGGRWENPSARVELERLIPQAMRFTAEGAGSLLLTIDAAIKTHKLGKNDSFELMCSKKGQFSIRFRRMVNGSVEWVNGEQWDKIGSPLAVGGDMLSDGVHYCFSVSKFRTFYDSLKGGGAINLSGTASSKPLFGERVSEGFSIKALVMPIRLP